MWRSGYACIFLHIIYSCCISGHQWSKVPKVCGNPLAALGCPLVDGVLYVAKLPVTADGKIAMSAGVLANVVCPCQVRGRTCDRRICLEAASIQLIK